MWLFLCSTRRFMMLSLIVSIAATGCSLDKLKAKFSAASSQKEALAVAADRLSELDQATYSYSDRFVTLLSDACDRAAKAHPTKEAQKEALRLKLHNASSIYAIATGPNPLGQLLDMTTMVTLNKINMVDEGRAKKIFGESHEIVERAFNAAYDDIWSVAGRFLQPNEIASIKRVILDWRKKHPQVSLLAYVRFDDFARANAGLKQQSPEIGGLFDQISEVNRTVETAQQFGERTFFYFQRFPRLLQWQTERTAQGVLDNTDLQKLQGSVQQMANATQIFAQEIQKLEQREAAIQKHLETVSKIVDQVHKLTPNTQAIIQDGQKLLLAATDTSNSLGTTLKVADKLSSQIASKDKPEPSDTKPFDINEYTQTASEVSKTINEANQLLATLQADGLAKRATQVQQLVDGEIDHITWRGVQFALFLFVLALLYRFISVQKIIKT